MGSEMCIRDSKRAIEAAENGADCLRINPGNIGDTKRVAEVVAFGSAINGTLLSIAPGTTVKLTSAELGWREGLVQLRIDSRTTRIEIKSKP